MSANEESNLLDEEVAVKKLTIMEESDETQEEDERTCCLCVPLERGIRTLAYMMITMSCMSVLHLTCEFYTEPVDR